MPGGVHFHPTGRCTLSTAHAEDGVNRKKIGIYYFICNFLQKNYLYFKKYNNKVSQKKRKIILVLLYFSDRK
ncbi:hypothetical protein MFUM_530001 [Methylacidiphilum fumariolicum SolV]|uniref:Uncharacterized protein n=1 Tax=Methylacidiphilum fumariolicum (strain SolV) TaxID=1156937 RepID=I0JYB8_METFB|nr:hypothetical protein MFUM_530001 [Methylacidiphilum fumariolicum SolV]